MNAPATEEVVDVVLDVLLLVEVLVDTAVLVVVEPAHPVPVHASQQLENDPTQAVPLPDGVQLDADFLSEHFVLPFLVRQQVTNPGLPQVDLAAHFLTAPLQLLGRLRLLLAESATHFTYWPWFAAVAHGQAASAVARAAATAAASPGSSPHLAEAVPPAAKSSAPPNTPIMSLRIVHLLFATSRTRSGASERVGCPMASRRGASRW
jgi:hypothetical protein